MLRKLANTRLAEPPTPHFHGKFSPPTNLKHCDIVSVVPSFSTATTVTHSFASQYTNRSSKPMDSENLRICSRVHSRPLPQRCVAWFVTMSMSLRCCMFKHVIAFSGTKCRHQGIELWLPELYLLRTRPPNIARVTDRLGSATIPKPGWVFSARVSWSLVGDSRFIILMSEHKED